MTAPNIATISSITCFTTGTYITTSSVVSIISNNAGSNQLVKVSTLNVANTSSVNAYVTVNWYNSSTPTGTGYALLGNGSIVPAASTLNVVDRNAHYYLQENTCIGIVSTSTNNLVITTCYEVMS